MTDSSIIIVCQSCNTKNRLDKVKLKDKPVCGTCSKSILSITPAIGSDKNLNRFITGNSLPIVVDFWAAWCGPCKQFVPIFEQVASEVSTRACLLKLDTEHNPLTAEKYTIRSIPTLIIFHKGKEVTRMSGTLTKPQFMQWLDQNLPII